MPDPPATDRNVVLLTVDSLRADYAYSADVPTPALDDLADSGARFETAIAPGPATYESMPAVFTGVQPGPAERIGGVNRRAHIATHLRAHRPLPERLRERGYTTVGVTPNPFTSRLFGFDAGFDRFVDFFDATGFGGGLRRRVVSRWADGEFVGGLRFASNMLGRGDVSVDALTVVERATAALEGVEEPFFLWLMFLDPHWPYQPSRGYRDGLNALYRYRANYRASNLSDAEPTDRDADAIRRLYRGTIRDVDDAVGTLRARLALYDPAVVVHSDHGEAFGEHGSYGHGGAVYEENVRVPLIVGNVDDVEEVGDAGAGAGTTVRAPTSLRAVPRLVEDLTDGEVDLRSYATDRTYATSERGDLCVRGPGWKYYAETDGTGRLYDLRTDPGERAGVVVDDDALLRRYRTALNESASLESATRNGISVRRL